MESWVFVPLMFDNFEGFTAFEYSTPSMVFSFSMLLIYFLQMFFKLSTIRYQKV